eukprot:scaffold1323_cov160-Amphora_coffeaeformis.AAC.15
MLSTSPIQAAAFLRTIHETDSISNVVDCIRGTIESKELSCTCANEAVRKPWDPAFRAAPPYAHTRVTGPPSENCPFEETLLAMVVVNFYK